MSLEMAIHDGWAASAGLEAALSAERLSTGRTAARAEMPYAVLRVMKVERLLPTNQGAAIEQFSLRVSIWHDGYDALRTIAALVRETFDDAILEVDASGRVARVAVAGDAVRQDEEGAWRWNVDLTGRVSAI